MVPRCLTVAGSDSGGGAGIQADLKTFTALGVYGMSAITSITVQNTEGVFGVFDLPPEVVYNQIKVVAQDIGVDSAKTGMLSNTGIVLAVARAVRDLGIQNLVVDPVFRAKSGDLLLREESVEVLVRELFPLALIVTPNIPEAEVLCGDRIRNLRDAENCAKKILEMGPRAVVIKGGHMEGDKVIDLFYEGGLEVHYFVDDRVETKNTHGTGCTFSAAICALIAMGMDLKRAVRKAKDFVKRAIETNPGIGKGHGPLNHMWRIEPCVREFISSEPST
ncbi:MAG: bifunctional hydroxymethylpyrimidine kinase/phosphomethylpyrimidine kinase [Aquificota bacterium]|nr:bifunctional hydroxymethylpyrimidine kinase/phosphomethylpyrimidine kinase [Aquificota bacterium]